MLLSRVKPLMLFACIIAFSFCAVATSSSVNARAASSGSSLPASNAFCQEGLTTSQKQTLESAKGKLRRVTANVKLANSTAGSGSGPLTGSRAKLTKVRLGNSPTELDQVRDLVKGLPESNPAVKSFQSSLSQLQNSIDTIQARIDGKPIPTQSSPMGDSGNEGQAGPPESAGVDGKMAEANTKLDYQQQEALKRADFNLRQVEGAVSTLGALTQSLRAIKDQTKVPYRQVAGGVSTLNDAQRKFGWVIDSSKALPRSGEGVAKLLSRIKQAETELKLAADYLLPLNQTLTKMVDPSSYPELQADTKRIQEISRMFSNKMILLSNRSLAAETVKQAKPALDEANRLADKYAALVQQQSAQGKAIDRQIQYLIKKQDEFLEFGQQQAAALPAEIGKHLERARSLADRAVENQKPLFFTGGIPQEFGFAEEKQSLLEVLDAKAAQTVAKQIKALRSELAVAQKKLSRKIIDENQLPADRYRGADRDKAIDVAVDAWKYQEKEFEVLASPIPSESWARETMWQYSNGTWYFVDRSKLQVRLIVADKEDPKLGVIRPVTVIKDHQKGDSLIGVPLWNIKDELPPSSYLLRSKLK